MRILAIESSCDETAAAVIEDGTRILSNVVVSQVDIFAAYGGVIPEVAARSHLEAILPVIHQALNDAGLTKEGIDAIAVTHTPGLLGSLLIGTLTARMLAILWHKPLYAVHHLKSHIYANWLEGSSSGDATTQMGEKSAGCDTPTFPLLALVVSGGHTQIIYMTGHNQFEIIGTTRDDAVGECYDKVAKILGLPYPGGPAIDRAALASTLFAVITSSDSAISGSETPAAGVKDWYKAHPNYRLPHPQVEGLDFSFSGLKTAVLRAVQAECNLPITTPSYELKEHLSEQQVNDFAGAFQETACEILIDKLKLALELHPEVKSVVVAGGVSANPILREKAKALEGHDFFGTKKVTSGLKVFFPERKFSGDNAAMVGAAAYFEILSGVEPTDPYKLNIAPRMAISAEN